MKVTEMTYSNLSKIKTKFRTKGNITGNFGVKKPVAGSSLNELGGDGSIGATQSEYLNRLYYAFDNTTDEKLRRFIYTEIRQILIQTNKW
jgi:hypothetical protein